MIVRTTSLAVAFDQQCADEMIGKWLVRQELRLLFVCGLASTY